jgi:phosphoglycolate phosphatase
MADFPFDTIVFDLDGTLADTAPDLAASLSHALAMLGRPAVSAGDVRGLIGQGGRVLLQRALGAADDELDALIAKTMPLFLDHHAANICVETRCYPEVEAAMDVLAARGVALAICTNKSTRMTDLLIDALGWQGRFVATVCADTLAVRKPDPAPLHEAIARAGGGKAAFVGDSITDADTAKAAGITFVAVGFGYSDRPAAQLGADALIHSYAELIPALERLGASQAHCGAAKSRADC